jgi:hypothetical protein
MKGTPMAERERRALGILAEAMQFEGETGPQSLPSNPWKMVWDEGKLTQLEGLEYSPEMSASSGAVVFRSRHSYLAIVSGAHPPSLPNVVRAKGGKVVIERSEDEWCMPLLVHRTARYVTYAALPERVQPVTPRTPNPGVLPKRIPGKGR